MGWNVTTDSWPWLAGTRYSGFSTAQTLTPNDGFIFVWRDEAIQIYFTAATQVTNPGSVAVIKPSNHFTWPRNLLAHSTLAQGQPAVWLKLLAAAEEQRRSSHRWQSSLQRCDWDSSLTRIIHFMISNSIWHNPERLKHHWFLTLLRLHVTHRD